MQSVTDLERRRAGAQLAAELLPVLDNLDRSIAAGGSDPMVQGVRQVRAQLEGVLRNYGLERFDALGTRFDPRVHDAVAVIDVPEPARHGLVVEQLEAGCQVGDRVIRPAKVAVGTFQRRQPRMPVVTDDNDDWLRMF
jgi:molecular chaperone GrpE